MEFTKAPRKRWSKNSTSIIRLPESKETFSAISSPRDYHMFLSQEKPVPAPRSITNMGFAFENDVFVSDNEEVLRIETDHNQESTKIEMRAMNNLPNVCFDRSHNIRTIEPGNILKRGKKDVSVMECRSNSTRIKNTDSTDSKDYSADRKERFSSSSDSKGCIRRANKKNKQERCTSDLCKSVEQSQDEGNNSDSLRKVRKATNGRYSSDESASANNKKISLNNLHVDDKLSKSMERLGYERKYSQNGIPKAQHKEKESLPAHSPNSTTDVGSRKKRKRSHMEKRKKDMKYISVTIHNAEMLETDYMIKHPMVKVHVVNTKSGNYLESSELQAHKHQVNSHYLQPIITRKCDFRKNRSMIPIWEEKLIFKHNFDVITRTENEQVMILFEIVDLLTFSEASRNYHRFGEESCWYKIAWAFWRPLGTNEATYIDKKLRLQLYRPRRNFKKVEPHKCEAYIWWKSNSRETYPSSLFVTVTSVEPPKLQPIVYQQLSFNDINESRNDAQKVSSCITASTSLPKWTRLAAQSCKIPNERFFETEISENGCFFVAFSKRGKYLACVTCEEYDYFIVVYEVNGRKIEIRFSGHKTFVYSLDWSNDDHYLLSVSSDQTARIWDVRNKIVQCIQLLPHPSYVYCGKFYPGNVLIVASGCYDKVARIWTKDIKLKTFELYQELEGHDGFVNSMCFQKEGHLLTADSVGAIIVWRMKRNYKMEREWCIHRRIRVREIEGVTINAIILHPLESRLLVHSRDNGLCMLDLGTGVILQKYAGLKNQRIQTSACISPCGSLILCGGEDTSLNVWSLETGKLMAKYTIEKNFRAVTCVDYHPYDHILAFSTFGSPAPVNILRFSTDATGVAVGLTLVADNNIGFRHNVTSHYVNAAVDTWEMSKWRSRRLLVGDFQGNEQQLIVPFESATSSKSALGNCPEYNETQGDYHTTIDTVNKYERLNNTGQTFKSRSAKRLYNIIEKIDRILSNTSRSSNGVEYRTNSTIVQYKDAKSITHNKTNITADDKKIRKRAQLRISKTNEQTSSFVDSSDITVSGCGVLESTQSFNDKENTFSFPEKSANVSKRKQFFVDKMAKAMSESVSQCGGQQVQREEPIRIITLPSTISIVESKGPHDMSPSSGFDCPQRLFKCDADRDSTSDSIRTYIVEKTNFERNNDLNSEKLSRSDNTIQSNKGSSELSSLKTDNSLCSNTTFIVENEISDSNSKRKKVLCKNSY